MQIDLSYLNILKRKILRKLLGPAKGKGEWRVGYNEEIYQLYRSPRSSYKIKMDSTSKTNEQKLITQKDSGKLTGRTKNQRTSKVKIGMSEDLIKLGII